MKGQTVVDTAPAGGAPIFNAALLEYIDAARYSSQLERVGYWLKVLKPETYISLAQRSSTDSDSETLRALMSTIHRSFQGAVGAISSCHPKFDEIKALGLAVSNASYWCDKRDSARTSEFVEAAARLSNNLFSAMG